MIAESQVADVMFTLRDCGLPVATGQDAHVERVLDTPISEQVFRHIQERAKGIGVSQEFKKILEAFPTRSGHTPAGFRRMLKFEGNELTVDLVRDISCDVDSLKRPTKVLYSADSANPYEVAPIAPFLSNLTCNPGIIYDLFLNDPSANVGGKFKNRDEVIQELGDILGPGCDISVELNNPFEMDYSRIIEEVERFKEILTPWRLVVKVPHTGPVNATNVEQLLMGDKRLSTPYGEGTTEDRLRGHNLALRLAQDGYKVNFTLMFEPYQTQMALQARPYFINSFIRHRKMQTERIYGLMRAFEATGDRAFLKDLRSYMMEVDLLPDGAHSCDLMSVLDQATALLHVRGVNDSGAVGDGLDAVRHSLRALRNSHLPDTRLIICSMEGDYNYPDIDRLVMEPEFADMAHRIIITAEPQYLARFTSANQVVSYQRRFMNAAAGQK
ncbi:transaldolase family protein [Schaalia sp. ZJ405]|uniref:transaldolase family protein n=1 Tax=Schaalia sp. ZJ405 TaxID=2709403 RepID=UPI0018CB2D2C|nr:transaldolase family protein [Schaalia sp. ZJ405]